MRCARVRGEAGQAGIAVLGALLAIVATLGLAVDGAALVTAKIGLSSDADAAARAGAAAVDSQSQVATGAIELDPVAADAAARAYAATECPQCSVTTVPGTAAITVTLYRQESTFFLQVLGIRSYSVAASSTASPVAP